jgi:hypothetical protein
MGLPGLLLGKHIMPSVAVIGLLCITVCALMVTIAMHWCCLCGGGLFAQNNFPATASRPSAKPQRGPRQRRGAAVDGFRSEPPKTGAVR